VAGLWWSEDDRLLASLGGALEEVRALPRDFVTAGKATYAWHDIDADLAALTYDSAAAGLADLSGVRAESASLRALTFASSTVAIELELTPDAIFGQVVPAREGTVTACRRDLAEAPDALIDELGYFVIRPIPVGTFRLRIEAGTGPDVLTGWVTP
jgi:hypothetical protein